jgi:hypothetical protein
VLSLSDHTPTANCLQQAERCALTSCRYHLGAERRTADGQAFRCAIDAANGTTGLSPANVARLLDMTESEVQRIERAAFPRARLALQKIKNEEHDLERQARERHARSKVPAASAPLGRAGTVSPDLGEASAPPTAPRRRPTPQVKLPAPPATAAPPAAPGMVAVVLVVRATARRRPKPRPRLPAVDARQMALSWGEAA